MEPPSGWNGLFLGARVIEVFVDLNVLFLIIRDRVLGENRYYWAHRLARCAVDTFLRIDVVHSLAFIYAVYWADIHASGVLNIDTGFNNYVGHTREGLPRNGLPKSGLNFP
jgi:hypothetical protein